MDQLTEPQTGSLQWPSPRGRGTAARGFAAVAIAGALLLSSACGTDPVDGAGSSVTLPASFPKADVPLVDGNLIDAGQRDQGGTTVYSVTVQAAPGGLDVAKSKLSDAGYLSLGAGPDGDTESAQFSGKGYVVTVSSVKNAAIPNAVYYFVSKA